MWTRGVAEGRGNLQKPDVGTLLEHSRTAGLRNGFLAGLDVCREREKGNSPTVNLFALDAS